MKSPEIYCRNITVIQTRCYPCRNIMKTYYKTVTETLFQTPEEYCRDIILIPGTVIPSVHKCKIIAGQPEGYIIFKSAALHITQTHTHTTHTTKP